MSGQGLSYVNQHLEASFRSNHPQVTTQDPSKCVKGVTEKPYASADVEVSILRREFTAFYTLK